MNSGLIEDIKVTKVVHKAKQENEIIIFTIITNTNKCIKLMEIVIFVKH